MHVTSRGRRAVGGPSRFGRTVRIASVMATCLTTAALALGLGALPANAESRTITDATGDVRTFTQIDGQDEDEPVDTPTTTPDGDIESVTYTHTSRRFKIAIDYVALERGHDSSGWYFELRGRNGQRRELSMVQDAGEDGVSVHMARSSNYRTVCKGKIRRSVDYAAGRVEVSFPRHCMARPRAVRVAQVGYWLTYSGKNDSTSTFHYDDPQREGGSAQQVGTRFSPWVARG